MKPVLMTVLTLGLFGCSDPYSKTLPPSIDKADESFSKAIANLPPADKEKVGAYLLRAAIANSPAAALLGSKDAPPTIGVTVRQAIDAQTAFETQMAKEADEAKAKAAAAAVEQAKRDAEAKALAEKMKAEADAKAKEISDAVTVAIENIQPADDGFSKAINIKVAFSNKSGKEISGVKGSFHISDSFDEELKTLNLSYDKNIKPGATAEWLGNAHVNQFTPGDLKVYQTPFDKLKVRWVPEVVLFTDSTKMEMPH